MCAHWCACLFVFCLFACLFAGLGSFVPKSMRVCLCTRMCLCSACDKALQIGLSARVKAKKRGGGEFIPKVSGRQR